MRFIAASLLVSVFLTSRDTLSSKLMQGQMNFQPKLLIYNNVSSPNSTSTCSMITWLWLYSKCLKGIIALFLDKFPEFYRNLITKGVSVLLN